MFLNYYLHPSLFPIFLFSNSTCVLLSFIRAYLSAKKKRIHENIFSYVSALRYRDSYFLLRKKKRNLPVQYQWRAHIPSLPLKQKVQPKFDSFSCSGIHSQNLFLIFPCPSLYAFHNSDNRSRNIFVIYATRMSPDSYKLSDDFAKLGSVTGLWATVLDMNIQWHLSY